MTAQHRRGWVPDGVASNAVAGVHKPNPQPQDSSLFDDWLKEDVKPIGGKPSGGPEQALANADQWWVSKALRCIQAARSLRDPFEPYDLQTQFGLEDPDSPKRWGALFRHAKRTGLIELSHYGPTKRPSANGRVVAYYRTWAK